MPRRTLQNFMALCLGTGSQVLIQIVSVPIFLHYWSFENYAIWLIAVNLSQFTGILDLGMITANQNRLPKLALGRNVQKILEYQSTTLIVFLLNNFVFGCIYLAFGGILGNPVPAFLFIIFVLNSGIQTLHGLIESSLRIEGKISLGINLSNFSRIIEFISMLVAILIFKENLYMVALISLLCKSILFLICIVKLNIRIGIKRKKFLMLSYLKSNLYEGYPFLLIKLSDILALSGIALLAQKFLSPAELVLFLTTRTFFRLGLQTTNLFNFTFYYELARAWSENNEKSFWIWRRQNLYLTFALTILVTIIFVTLGENLFKTWTHNELTLSTTVLTAGTLYSVVMMLSQAQKISFHASNNNREVSQIQFTLTLLALCSLATFTSLQSVENVFYLLSATELISLIVTSSLGKGWTKRQFNIDE